MKLVLRMALAATVLFGCGSQVQNESETDQFVQYDQECVRRVNVQMRQEQEACFENGGLFENCIPTAEEIQKRISVCIIW